MRAGRGDVEPGGDQPVPGLDDPPVAVRGAGLDDGDHLGGARGRVHHGGAVGGGQLAEYVGDGDQAGGRDVEGGVDPGPAPPGVAERGGGGAGGQFAAEGEGGFGPVEHGDGPGAAPSAGSGQMSAAAQTAAPVPPPMSVWPEGVHCGTASASAPSAARSASKVAGIRYAA